MTGDRIVFTLDMARDACADRAPGPFGLPVQGHENEPSFATVRVGPEELAIVGDTIVRHPDGSFSIEP